MTDPGEGTDVTERTCTAEGCTKPHRARGLCSTHYNQAHQPGRHRREQDCEACGTRYATTRTDGRFCSLACRDHWRWGLSTDLPLDHPVRWYGATCPIPAPEPPPIRWVAGKCRWCGDTYVDRWLGSASSRTCSRRCGRRWGEAGARHRRRTRTRTGDSGLSWRVVADHDGLICWICDEPCDPSDYEDRGRVRVAGHRYPSLDHVVPLSLGGEHTLENSRLAHRLCNALRGAPEPSQAA